MLMLGAAADGGNDGGIGNPIDMIDANTVYQSSRIQFQHLAMHGFENFALAHADCSQACDIEKSAPIDSPFIRASRPARNVAVPVAPKAPPATIPQ